MTRAHSLFVLSLSLPLALSVVACSKKVDPSQFDAGVSAAPAAPTVAPADTTAQQAAPAAVDSVAPLASLTPAAAAKPVAAAGSGGAKKAGTTPVNKNLPECEEARKWCNHPAAKFDKAIQANCTTSKQACFAKGGNL